MRNEEVGGKSTAGAYEAAFKESIQDPASFWGTAGREMSWSKTWDRVLDDANPPFYRWFVGAE